MPEPCSRIAPLLHGARVNDHIAHRGQPTTSHHFVGKDVSSELKHKEIIRMLHYAVVFFIIALVAAVLGFGGIAAGAAGIAKILFVVFLILAIASLVFGRSR